MTAFQYNNLKCTNTIWLPEIPDQWEMVKVRHLFKEHTKKGFPDEPLLVASQELGVVSKEDYGKRTMETTKDFHLMKLVEKGDFVISLRSFQGGIELAHQRGIISPGYTIIKPIRNISQGYFKHLFKSKPFISLMQLCVKGIRDGQNIDFPTFKGEKLPFPPLEDQNEIAKYLDRKIEAIDKFIRNKERLIELLEEERREFIDAAINQPLTVPSVKKPLKCIAKLISEQTSKRNFDERYLALENIISWTGIIDFSIGLDEFENSAKRFKNGDVLFNKLRPYLAKVVIPDFNGICVGELLVLRPNRQISREYLFFKLISRRFIDYVDSTSYGTKMPRASWEVIGKIEIEVPKDITFQQNVVSRIKNEEARITRLKSKVYQEINSNCLSLSVKLV